MRSSLSSVVAGVAWLLVVIQQSDDDRAFNRGQLLNVGFREAMARASSRRQRLVSVIFHDVDLLPSDGLLPWYYTVPEAGQPVHIAAPTAWGKYDILGYSEVFFGGVTAINPSDFVAANGYPNNYWGCAG